MKGKTFIKFFLIFLVLFTLILIPAVKAVSNINLFEKHDVKSIEEKMGVLVDSNSPFFEAFTKSKRMNMLVMGVNQNMTDVIMLVTWDMDHDKVSVVSIPRDTYYYRDGYHGASLKINSIYGSKHDIVGIANAVSDTLCGIPINYYAVVDYDSVRKIVDGIGGVPINVPKALTYDDPYDKPPLHIRIPAGDQVLDGDHAVQYLRFRKGYANGDIGRIEAQQKFIKSAFKQALDNGIIDSAKLITSNVESDLTVGAAAKYALSAISLKEDSIKTYMVPGHEDHSNGPSYWMTDQTAIEEMLAEIYQINDENSEESSAEKE